MRFTGQNVKRGSARMPVPWVFAPLAILLLSHRSLPAQSPSLCIHSVQRTDGAHGHVELRNNGDSEVSLQGMVLMLGPHRHEFGSGLILHPHGSLVLHASSDPVLDLPWSLPGQGGTLLLLSADRSMVVDGFTYPAMPPGWRMARGPAGGQPIMFLAGYTPGEQQYCCASMNAPPLDTSGIATWALLMDPADLYDPERGIDVEGNHANFSRKGRAWERPGLFATSTDTLALAVTVRVAGNGSRSMAKRSFRVEWQEGLPGGRPFTAKGMVLRADAQANALLRNVFINEAAVRAGARVDVLPSIPVRLVVNQERRGLYRAMPRRNAEWLGRELPAARLDLVDGPAAPDKRQLDHCLAELRNSVPINELDTCMDLSSMLEMACFDLYTGRVDHDLNTCAWRPRTPGGRWRWVMHDMDLWSGAPDNSVDLLCTAPPGEEALVRDLMEHAETRSLLLGRLQALLNTVLSPPIAIGIADSLFAPLKNAMWEDHLLWADRLERPDPDLTKAGLDAFLRHRPTELLHHLSEWTGDPLKQVRLSVSPAGAGWIMWEDLRLPETVGRFAVLNSIPLQLRAVPAEGFEFVGWKGSEERGDVLTWLPDGLPLVAVFRLVGTSHRHRL